MKRLRAVLTVDLEDTTVETHDTVAFILATATETFRGFVRSSVFVENAA